MAYKVQVELEVKDDGSAVVKQFGENVNTAMSKIKSSSVETETAGHKFRDFSNQLRISTFGMISLGGAAIGAVYKINQFANASLEAYAKSGIASKQYLESIKRNDIATDAFRISTGQNLSRVAQFWRDAKTQLMDFLTDKDIKKELQQRAKDVDAATRGAAGRGLTMEEARDEEIKRRVEDYKIGLAKQQKELADFNKKRIAAGGQALPASTGMYELSLERQFIDVWGYSIDDYRKYIKNTNAEKEKIKKEEDEKQRAKNLAAEERLMLESGGRRGGPIKPIITSPTGSGGRAVNYNPEGPIVTSIRINPIDKENRLAKENKLLEQQRQLYYSIGEASTAMFNVISINANRTERAWMMALSSISSGMGNVAQQFRAFQSAPAGFASIIPGLGLVAAGIGIVGSIIDAVNYKEDKGSSSKDLESDTYREMKRTTLISQQKPANVYYNISNVFTADGGVVAVGPDGIPGAANAITGLTMRGIAQGYEDGRVSLPAEVA